MVTITEAPGCFPSNYFLPSAALLASAIFPAVRQHTRAIFQRNRRKEEEGGRCRGKVVRRTGSLLLAHDLGGRLLGALHLATAHRVGLFL